MRLQFSFSKSERHVAAQRRDMSYADHLIYSYPITSFLTAGSHSINRSNVYATNSASSNATRRFYSTLEIVPRVSMPVHMYVASSLSPCINSIIDGFFHTVICLSTPGFPPET